MIDKLASLPNHVIQVVKEKGTEPPFTTEFPDSAGKGTYVCRECGIALFRSESKFHSGCGWPSFDEEIPGTITYQADKDGERTEITCTRCHAHLGHVFLGEGYTAKMTRHCVNTLSLDFIQNAHILDTEEAIFAAGCFWGVEYYFRQLPGVLKTEVGYTGGKAAYPNYTMVCSGKTGHVEAIRVLYDPTKIDYEQIAKFFFEIHDPSQANGQGPDIGNQYLSTAFYYNIEQKETLLHLINLLESKGLSISTQVMPVKPFWKAEVTHQAYYLKNKKTPYCHFYQKRF